MTKISGIFAASMSVLNSDLSLNVDKTIEHAEKLIEQGCHGTAIFGSTGQAQLISISEKIELLNKTKKVINTFEKIEKINEINLISKNKEKVNKNKVSSKPEQKKLKKTKTLKKKIRPLRTLWVRRKKKN